jgi:hypothetical protein
MNAADATLAEITVNAADSTVTLTLKNDVNIGSGHIFNIVYNVKDDGSPASQCATGTLVVKVYPMPNYSDIRVRVCPDVGDVNLAKYIDTTDIIKSLQWAHQTSGISITSPEGKISTNVLAFSRINTFTYTISSRCVSERKRKVYIETLKNDEVRTPRDTIAICYLYAEAVQINQLLGIEANGMWTYSSDIEDYITESKSPASPYFGAVVMNGKGIYEEDDILPASYRGVSDVKIVKFIYTADSGSCLKGKQYEIVIVLTKDITF